MNEKTDIHENLITLPFFPVTLLIEKDETGYSIVKVTVVLKWLYLSIFTTFGQKNRCLKRPKTTLCSSVVKTV